MLLVWLVVTASAVTVAWFGIDSVVGVEAVVSPQLLTPIDPSGVAGALVAAGQPATGAGQATEQPVPTTPVASDPVSSPTPGQSSTDPGTPPAPPTPSSGSGDDGLRRFSLVGGVVVAQFNGDVVTFVSATPSPGYQMVDWIESGQDWLRVDFTDSTENDIVYSLFITWNGYSPQWTEAGPGWTQTGT